MERDIKRLVEDADRGDEASLRAIQRTYARTGQSFFYVPESKINLLARQIKQINDSVNKINSASQKAHTKALKADPNFDGEPVRIPNATVTISTPRMITGPQGMYSGCDAVVSIPDLKVSGEWIVAADVDINWTNERTNVVNRAPNYVGPLPLESWYAERECSCDHCGLNRLRKKVFVLRNQETGAFMLVGKSCVKDFVIGVTGQRLLSHLLLEKEIKQELGIYKITEDRGVFALPFVSALRYGMSGRNAWSYALSVTLDGAVNTDAHIIQSFNEQSQVALDWLAQVNADHSDDLRNLKAAYAFQGVLHKHIKIASDIWEAYDYHHQKDQQVAEFSIKRGQFSSRKGAVVYTMTAPYNREFQDRFKRMFRRGMYSWNKTSKTWSFWTNSVQTAQSVHDLCEEFFGVAKEEQKQDTTKPSHTLNGDTHTVSIPMPDSRFIVRCVGALDLLKVSLIGKSILVTTDTDTAREAYKQALWCLAHPVKG
jgi:hypothetical protein